jgi:hypothetical protein
VENIIKCNDDDDMKEMKQDQKIFSFYEKLKHKIGRASFQKENR